MTFVLQTNIASKEGETPSIDQPPQFLIALFKKGILKWLKN